MLHISMETGPATQSPVAEVEPCSTSAFWSRRPPATPCDSTATSRGAVVGRWSLRFWYCESAFRVKIFKIVFLAQNSSLGLVDDAQSENIGEKWEYMP